MSRYLHVHRDRVSWIVEKEAAQSPLHYLVPNRVREVLQALGYGRCNGQTAMLCNAIVM